MVSFEIIQQNEVDMKDKGTIIILNGPSSCGKTTLSKNLQKIWKTPLYHLSYDIVDGYI